MKTFIVTLAVVALLLVFPLQNVLDIVNGYRINRFDDIVHRSAQMARLDGYFTETNIDELKSNIIGNFPGIGEDDIVLNLETNLKVRTDVFDERELIHYEISVPIKKVIAAGLFLGIPESENMVVYTKKGYVLSEVLP